MAFISKTGGLAIAIVFLPLLVSMSNVKTLLSPGAFNRMISVFFSQKSIPIYASF